MDGEVDSFLFFPLLLSIRVQGRLAFSQFVQGLPFAAALHLTRLEWHHVQATAERCRGLPLCVDEAWKF